MTVGGSFGTGAFMSYSNDQLRCGVIHGLLVDSLDNIWVGTNAGIVRYDPATNAYEGVATGYAE